MTVSDSSKPYSPFRKLLSYLKPHWLPVMVGIVALLVVNGIGVYLPLLIRDTVDQFSLSFDFSEIQFDILILVGLATLMWLIRMISRVSIFGVGRKVEFDLKQKIFDHLLTLDPAYFAIHTPGDLINRATSDVDSIRRLVGFVILSLANTTFAYAFTLPVMLAIDARLTLMSVAVYPLLMLIVKFFSQRLRDQQNQVQKSLSNLSDLIQEDMSGISLIKIYAQEENEKQAFRDLNLDLLNSNIALARTQTTLFPFLGGIASISLLVLLAFGSRAIADGGISVGDFVALLLYVEKLIFPTAILGFTITAYQRGMVSLDRIEAILTETPAIVDTAQASPVNHLEIKGAIAAQDLTLRYPGAQANALEHVSLTIQPGQMVAIVGPVGSGKTTLANCLPRLLNVASGQIWIDGQDVTDIPLRDLRAAIAYVPQDSFLFSASIKNNIRYGDPVASLAQVEASAQEARIHEEILNFPKQYETPVGERGITLSGGQRQRSALARALMTDSPILILDDALASVDNQTATFILERLTHQKPKKTVIFISHQLSAAAIADQILVMDQGSIVQSGTHDELLNQSGLYQKLWSQQQLEARLKD
jgi:ATP-binding cassette, subfamily B, multidrug efflux pump